MHLSFWQWCNNGHLKRKKVHNWRECSFCFGSVTNMYDFSDKEKKNQPIQKKIWSKELNQSIFRFEAKANVSVFLVFTWNQQMECDTIYFAWHLNSIQWNAHFLSGSLQIIFVFITNFSKYFFGFEHHFDSKKKQQISFPPTVMDQRTDKILSSCDYSLTLFLNLDFASEYMRKVQI